MRKLGSVEERKGQPQNAIRWFHRAAAQIPARTRNRTWLATRADVRLAEAGVLARQDDNATCVRIADEALWDARRAHDDAAIALALERKHLGLVGLMEIDRDGVGLRALAAHRERGDHNGMARTLINLGVEAYFESRWSDAAAHYLEALDAAERAGSVVLAANAAINSAEVLCDQGSWQRALELFDGATRNYNAVGYTPGAAATSLFSSVAAMRDGDLAGAQQRLAHARHEIERLEMEFLGDLRSRELELEVLQGIATLEGCADALESSRDDPMLTARAVRCRAGVYLEAGDIRLALDDLEQLLADYPTPDFERANALRLTARIAPHDTRTPSWNEESATIYKRLGVTQAPPLTAADVSDHQTEVPGAGK